MSSDGRPHTSADYVELVVTLRRLEAACVSLARSSSALAENLAAGPVLAAGFPPRAKVQRSLAAVTQAVSDHDARLLEPLLLLTGPDAAIYPRGEGDSLGLGLPPSIEQERRFRTLAALVRRRGRGDPTSVMLVAAELCEDAASGVISRGGAQAASATADALRASAEPAGGRRGRRVLWGRRAATMS